MAWWQGLALVGCMGALACAASTSNGGSSESSSDGGTQVDTGPSCDPIAAVLVSIADEYGAPVSPDVSYSVAGGPFLPASCVQLGRCIVSEGYGQSITVRVTANGCTTELDAIGASDMCAATSPELSFTVYDNCTGDPTSSGYAEESSSDGSSEGDSSTSSSSDDTSGTSESSSGSESSSSSTG
ncbi:MAG TPA: hypothetical protein VG755_36905 [Nannocystaceae bacterium]|nr:hypothetical protein [Nannocystaceae bacterium]